MNEAFRNEVHVHGTLAKDPILKYTASGKCVANLSILTKYEKYSEFHKVVLWEKLAEKSAEVKKGAFVKVVGRLQTRSWDDKQSGQKKYITEIIAYQIAIPDESTEPTSSPIGGKAIAESILSPSANNPNIHGVTVTEDDIPF